MKERLSKSKILLREEHKMNLKTQCECVHRYRQQITKKILSCILAWVYKYIQFTCKSKFVNAKTVSMMQLIFSFPTHDWSSLSKPWIFPERACHYLSIICQSCSVLLKQYLGLIRICFVLRGSAKSIGKSRHKVKDLGCLYFSVFSLCDL